jgi:hypothetical protein
MTNISLTTGTLDTNNNLDGWVITSDRASYVPDGVPEHLAGDLTVEMVKGDKIDINGNVYHDGQMIGNIAL